MGAFLLEEQKLMGRAGDRRKRRRQEYLARLAETDPAQFSREWAKRISSWAIEARERASTLTADGEFTPPAFEVVSKAMEELAACGETTMAFEGDATKEALVAACCKALAEATDLRLYRLSNIG